MKIEQFIELMDTFEALKRNTRHSWLSDGRHESVAEHCWRLAMMAYFTKDEFPSADNEKVIKMCLVHDLGEAFTGDIPSFEKTAFDEAVEKSAVELFVGGLPEPYKSELEALFSEMAEGKTLEAKIWCALDKMEAVIQHNEADISTWLPLEYTENIAYGKDAVAFSEYMKTMKENVNRTSEEKIQSQRLRL